MHNVLDVNNKQLANYNMLILAFGGCARHVVCESSFVLLRK